MFVEKKLNKSGSTSVRVMQKVHGKRKCVKVIGHSNDTGEIELLVKRGGRWIEEHRTGVPLFEFDDEAAAYDRVLAVLRQSQLRLVGPELIYGTLFDRIGYDKVKTANNALFRALVATRLYHPESKLGTAEYMERFMHRSYSSDAIYRFLDELCVRDKTAEQVREATDESIGVKWQVEQVAFGHTKAVMGGQVTVAFYDTSTLYFESQEDDIRVPGYSKDGKNENPQVVLGLLVGTGGNPIGYELHKGNQYEGTTLLPIVKKLERRFNLSHPMIVADAGLLSEKNIKQLEEDGYEYIIEMDADFSHDPNDLPRLYAATHDEGYDVAVGSRYVSGVNVVNWPIGRVLMSYFASKYVRAVTGFHVHDTTAGFVCYRRRVLETIPLDMIRFKGYAFQIEMKYTSFKIGFKIKEVPVIFVNRREGTSKMSGGIFSEAFFGVIRLRMDGWFRKYPKIKN